MLLFHNTGAQGINPLVCQALDGKFEIFTSKGGVPTNPA